MKLHTITAVKYLCVTIQAGRITDLTAGRSWRTCSPVEITMPAGPLQRGLVLTSADHSDPISLCHVTLRYN